VAWYEDLCAGPVTAVSFANTEVQIQAPENSEKFIVPDFIVATSNAFIIGVSSSIYEEYDVEKRRGTLLMQGINDDIHGLSAHPKTTQIAVSCYSGSIQLWDYDSKRLVMMRKFDSDKLRPQCLVHDPNGKFLAVGFTNGSLKLLHSTTLRDVATFRQTKVFMS